MKTPDGFWDIPELFSHINFNRSAGSKTTGLMLSSLVFSNDVQVALDIGIFNGFTTQCLGWSMACNAGPDATLFSIDIGEVCCKIARDCSIPVDHRIICADTMTLDFEKLLDGKMLDLAFIDGDHSYPGEYNDIAKVKPFLKDSGIMVVHDYNYGLPEVMRAVADNFDFSKYDKFIIKERGSSGDIQSVIIQKKS